MSRPVPLRAQRRPRRLLLLAPLALIASVAAAAAVLAPGGAGAATTTSGNLVVDPGFAHGTGAWRVSSGAALRVVAGHDGHRAIAVTNTTRRSMTVNLNDRVNTVARTVKGATYTASAWIRIAKRSLTAAVREGEWKGSTAQATPVLTSAWLHSSGWRFVRVVHTAVSNGATIDLNLLAWQLPPKVQFYVSQPSLIAAVPQAASGGSSSSTPVPAPTSSSPVDVPTTPGSSSPIEDPTTPAADPTTATSAPPVADPTTPTPDPTTPDPTTPTPDPTTPTPTPSTTAPETPKLVFSDDFGGTSVDPSKWRVRNNTWGTNEYSLLTSRPDNVFVSNGVLTIRAQRERYTAYSQTRDYTSGYLDTIGLHSQQYGRWVMRAKLPTAKGLWPAFWLRSDHTPGEIDILESVGGLNRMTSQTVLQSTTDHTVKQTHTYNVTGTIADWHVYGFTWTPSAMTWDIDGVTVFSVKASDYAWSSTAFQDTMNIRLNLQVGGAMPAWWKSDVDATTQFPADYVVDWVRVYAG